MLEFVVINENNKQEELSKLEEKGFSDIIEKTILFNDIEEAKEYVSDIIKDNVCIKVPFLQLVEEENEDSKALQEIKDRLSREQESLELFPQTIINKLKEQLSNKKGCKCCGSSINRDYLIKNLESIENISTNDLTCPICKDKEFMFNSSEEKRLNNLINRIKSLESKKENMEITKFMKAKKEKVYLIGYQISDI